MGQSRSKNIEYWLIAADTCLLLVWALVSVHLPVNYQKTLAWVMAFAWVLGLITVGGYNSIYLRPRRRILVSMTLSLSFSTIVGIFWAGSGHNWYMIGGVHFLIALTVTGMTTRLLLSCFLQRPATQVVPYRLSKSFLPLLEEIAQHVPMHIEPVQDDPSASLPQRRVGYPIFLAVTDSRLRDSDFNVLFPLYTQIEVVDVCELYESLLFKAPIIETAHGWSLPTALRVPSAMHEVVKRIFDIFFVLLTSLCTLPLVGIGALLIKLTSPGPVFFMQERLGRYGKPFRLFKLRTMVAHAEELGAQWSGARDTRVTPVGRMLRATALDELPQFWNILRGEMSLVGPRPEQPEIVRRLESLIPFYDARLLVPPGLTGWAQLHQGGDASLQDVANKLRYDLYYIKYGTLAMDLRILLNTAQMLLHVAKPVPKERVKGEG